MSTELAGSLTSPGFDASVRKHFAFLKTEFGFVDKVDALGYEKNGLEVDFHYGKGEVDILFYVRRSDAIFKPHVSRSFELLDIVRRLKGSRPGWPAGIPSSTTSLLSEEHVELYLVHRAGLMREFCTAQLQGDLSLFEQIHLSRR